ncbi:hypothetical protein QR680_004083 [Steinernema hermaphroditum]|uniref:Bifunctional lysine-specific demethylase and histidyl-hydroxylase n=1 Tax=Steinernema hermaphroditum TaxID=289476 RepID=A0AA39LT36_9BILA|nr:hypothetical protein QR680_004083 [Steinernema hermaphroditum]
MGRNRNKFKQNKDAAGVPGVKVPDTASEIKKKQQQMEEKLKRMYDNLDSLESAASKAKEAGTLKEKAYSHKKEKAKSGKVKRVEANFSAKDNKITENAPQTLSKTQKKKLKKKAKKAAEASAKVALAQKKSVHQNGQSTSGSSNKDKPKDAQKPQENGGIPTKKGKKDKKKDKQAQLSFSPEELSERKRRAKHPSPDPKRFENFQQSSDVSIEELDSDEDQTPATRFDGKVMKKGTDYDVVNDYQVNYGEHDEEDEYDEEDDFDEEGEDDMLDMSGEDGAVFAEIIDEDSGEELEFNGEEGGYEDEDEEGFGEDDEDEDEQALMEYDNDCEALFNNILRDGKDVSLYSNMDDDDEEEDDSGSDLDSLDEEDAEAALVVKTATPSGKAPVDFSTFPFSKSHHSVQNANSAFQWILGPCELQTFFKSIFEKKTLHVKRNDKKYYGNLFSTPALVDLIEKHCLEYGNNINIASYKNGVRTTLNGEGRVYPQTVQNHLQLKRSVQFVNPQTFDDNVWYLCEVLQELFCSFVGANTYLTPASSAGFAPHWDEIDAFILQLEGSKRWKVYGPEGKEDSLPRESSGNFTDAQMKHRKPLFDDVVHAGDLLYVPRGFIHQALTTNEHSFHITISVCRRNAFADMMEKLIPEVMEQLAEKSAHLRKSLPCNYLDMGGIADCEYPNDESYSEKLLMPFNMHIRNLAKLTRSFVDNGVDMMAREFMKTSLPPVLTPYERKYSVIGKKIDLLSQKPTFKWTKDTKIRLIRKHAQRLIFESADKAFIAHRMNNSRLYEGKPEQVIDIGPEMVAGFTNLVTAYPEYITVGDLECEAHGFDVALAQILYNACLILVDESK